MDPPDLALRANLVYLDPPYIYPKRLPYKNFLYQAIANGYNKLPQDAWLVIWCYYKIRYIIENLIAENFVRLKLENEIIWHFTFGSYSRHRFVSSHDTLLVYKVGRPKFYWEQVAVVSERMLSGDIRADMRGRTPDDVWKISRQPGNASERHHNIKCPKQPRELVERIVKAYTKPFDIVYDPMMGTGTTGEVCKINQRHFYGMDKKIEYVETFRNWCRWVDSNENLIDENK